MKIVMVFDAFFCVTVKINFLERYQEMKENLQLPLRAKLEERSTEEIHLGEISRTLSVFFGVNRE